MPNYKKMQCYFRTIILYYYNVLFAIRDFFYLLLYVVINHAIIHLHATYLIYAKHDCTCTTLFLWYNFFIFMLEAMKQIVIVKSMKFCIDNSHFHKICRY